MSEGITFRASFAKATTLIDGGWRISFDLSKNSGINVVQVAALGSHELQVAVVPFEIVEDALETIIDG